jgi:hypothetical protein
MVGHQTVPSRRDGLHPTDVDEKRDEFPSAAGEVLRARQVRRIIGEEFRVMPAHHPGARTRRCDDVVIALERVEHLQGDRSRIAAIARIVCRLATAGLGARHLDRATGFLEQLDGGKTDRRPEEIHQAGYEERCTHRPSHHYRGPGLG